ncbi:MULTISPECIES: hypothetical protein [unclassified Bradyrhizobium]|uniref:hypothetical protein n=1 Tax=Bradyrhizobium TaxID=374 RepID=UPI0028E96656|nr:MULTISPECIES: hypothetical protein [unclassified Bradyrhizobium]
MNANEDVRAALANIPVSWLHMPALAFAEAGAAGAKEFGPKIAPAVLALGAAAAGAIIGGGLQLTHQYLHDSKAGPVSYQGIDKVICTATFAEIEAAATRIYQESAQAKDGNALQQIIDTAAGAKFVPALAPVAGAAAAFLAGVYAGAAAARH